MKFNKYSEVKYRFYFSYIKDESNYLKSKGFEHLSKGIHPKTGVMFSMYDKTPELLLELENYREQNKTTEE